MKTCASFVLVLALVACGGSKQSTDGPTPQTPPRLPPSMSGGGLGGSGGADVPPENTVGSEEVAKGEKALTSGDVTAAKSYADAALKKNPKDPEAFALLGEIAEKSSDKPGAEKAYKDALKLRPDLETAAVNLSAMYDEGEKWDDAEKVSRAGLTKHPDNPALHFNLAVALAGKNDAAGSTKEFDDATRLAPNDPVYLFTYGHWLGVFKQPDAAAVKLRAARPLAGDDVSILASIGNEMRLVGAWADCVPTFDKAIGLKDLAELRTYRALCKLAGKDKTGALADLQAAVAKEPKFAPAHYYLAGQLAQGGKFKEAAAEYDTYIKLSPNGPLAKQAQERAKLARDKAAGKK
jgi:Tfp pilus assembly protein PilF